MLAWLDSARIPHRRYDLQSRHASPNLRHIVTNLFFPEAGNGGNTTCICGIPSLAPRPSSILFDYFSPLRPILHRLDPETAHNLTLKALEHGLAPAQPEVNDPILATSLMGRRLAHPLGLAAGFDKQARVFRPMFRQGFAMVEVGGITPRPQAGNPRPRLFRLSADRAVINRMGFNNVGLEAAIAQVANHGPLPGPLGVNLASNSDSADPAADFEVLVRGLAPHVDYLVVDVSCPNTANGKVFQNPDKLAPLLDRLIQVRGEVAAKAPPEIWLKIAPDLTETELQEICAVAMSAPAQGMIVSNTTIERPDGLASAEKGERGGLSGAPLFGPSTARLASVRRFTRGQLPLIGVGGIFSGADAYAKIRAGASGLQLYTAMVYEGPAVVTRIKRSLADLLRRDGFSCVDSAVGSDAPIEAAPLLKTA